MNAFHSCNSPAKEGLPSPRTDEETAACMAHSVDRTWLKSKFVWLQSSAFLLRQAVPSRSMVQITFMGTPKSTQCAIVYTKETPKKGNVLYDRLWGCPVAALAGGISRSGECPVKRSGWGSEGKSAPARLLLCARFALFLAATLPSKAPAPFYN